MKKLYEILNQKLHNGDVGIEIEVEGARLIESRDKRWTTTVDGSLRGENKEYILTKPLPANEVRNALQALKDELVENRSKLNFSFRTSVHVHINCQDLTYTQYLNFLYTYLLLEEPLMTYCGKERKGNRFCLRLQDAEGMIEWYQGLFQRGSPYALQELPKDTLRYSAMNVEATPKYGSLEFRGMRGNLDVDVLDTWVKALINIREFAKSEDTPVDVYNTYAKLEAHRFIHHVLKDVADAFIYPKVVKDIQKSFSLSLDLPFAFKKEDVNDKGLSPDIIRRQKAALNHMMQGGALPRDYVNPLPDVPEGWEIYENAQRDYQIRKIVKARVQDAVRPARRAVNRIDAPLNAFQVFAAEPADLARFQQAGPQPPEAEW